MRALVLRAENEMPAVQELPLPESKDGQVLVRVSACGINYADTMIRRGLYLSKPSFPFVPGFEYSGTVEKGSGAWSDGDAVMGMGPACYAEFVSVPASTLMPVPSGFSAIEAAAFPVTYLTAMAMLRLSAKAHAEETILIHSAAGGVGTAAIQLSKALGLTVIATASTEAKLALARSLGADYTVNYLGRSYVEPVRELTGSRGVDIVLNGVGGETIARDFEVTAPFGTIVIFGSACGERTDPQLLKMFPHSLSVCAFWLSTLTQNQEQLNEVLSELVETVERHDLRPVIGRTYSFEQATQAWEDMESRRSTGKLLLLP